MANQLMNETNPKFFNKTQRNEIDEGSTKRTKTATLIRYKYVDNADNFVSTPILSHQADNFFVTMLTLSHQADNLLFVVKAAILLFQHDHEQMLTIARKMLTG